MSNIKKQQIIDRWKTDYDFKTVTAALGSLAVTAVFALYNGFLGIRHDSVWYGSISVYYIVLVILRGVIIAAEKRNRTGSRRARKTVTAFAASVLLLLLNISLIVPVSLMVTQQKPVRTTLIPAIAMAAYTVVRTVMASVNLNKGRKSADSLVRLLRTIGFIEALVSILTLQTTLIAVCDVRSGAEMLPLTAVVGGAVLLTVLYLSVAAVVRNSRLRDRQRNKQPDKAE